MNIVLKMIIAKPILEKHNWRYIDNPRYHWLMIALVFVTSQKVSEIVPLYAKNMQVKMVSFFVITFKLVFIAGKHKKGVMISNYFLTLFTIKFSDLYFCSNSTTLRKNETYIIHIVMCESSVIFLMEVWILNFIANRNTRNT